jgi:hypothetical protein
MLAEQEILPFFVLRLLRNVWRNMAPAVAVGMLLNTPCVAGQLWRCLCKVCCVGLLGTCQSFAEPCVVTKVLCHMDRLTQLAAAVDD